MPPLLRQPEGPFGDHYGYYSLRHDYPVFEVEAIARRRDAIYPATVVGKPRQEDFYIGDLLQELLSPLFPLVMPGVESLWSYGETGYHSLAAAIVKERYGREAMASAFRILGEGQLSLTKFLLLTDRPVDLRDFRATLEHVLARTRPETDLYVFSNLSMDTLDYTGPTVNEGSKGVWLGLGDPVRELPREFRPHPPPRGHRRFCSGCLVSRAVLRAGGGRRRAWPPTPPSPVAARRLTDEPQRHASAMNLWTTLPLRAPDIHRRATLVHVTSPCATISSTPAARLPAQAPGERAGDGHSPLEGYFRAGWRWATVTRPTWTVRTLAGPLCPYNRAGGLPAPYSRSGSRDAARGAAPAAVGGVEDETSLRRGRCLLLPTHLASQLRPRSKKAPSPPSASRCGR